MRYVQVEYLHETDWTSKAVFEGYEYSVIDAYVDSLKSYVLEYGVLRVNSRDVLRKVLGILNTDESVEELVRFEPLNSGYPRRFGVIIKSRLSNSTRYKARLLDGIEVRDYISQGVEEWGFVFPYGVDTEFFINSLTPYGKVLNVKVKLIRFDELIGLLNSGRVTILLTKSEVSLLRKAYRLGFFDEPRRVSLRSLAKEAGLSASTVSHVLRNGLRKLMRYLALSYD